MNDQKIDGRVRRTKRLLKEGLTELMLSKSIKKITVRELSDLVEINRGTFYLHYKDIYDLVEQIEDELFVEFESILANYEGNEAARKRHQMFTDVCRFLDKNRKICSALLSDNGDLNFVMKLRAFIADKCFNDYSRAEDIDTNNELYNYLYAFFESGAVGIARYWLNDTSPERKTPEEIALILETLLIHGAGGFLSDISIKN